jgi:hypothetical protein
MIANALQTETRKRLKMTLVFRTPKAATFSLICEIKTQYKSSKIIKTGHAKGRSHTRGGGDT